MSKSASPTPPTVTFIPLGGSGEIGMNLNVYGCQEKFLIVDCGITFGDDATPGVDVMMPDPSFLEEHKKSIVGLVATHAHEDHIGAIPYLWQRLKCPIYATPFTAEIIKAKLASTGFAKEVPLHVIPLSGTISLKPFSLQLITLTHSILEPNAVVIRTPAGTILHTGDWKIDPKPQMGDATDEAALRALAAEDVLAMVCDSTNVFETGSSGSEEGVAKALAKEIRACKGKVAVCCFATNVARVHSVIMAAKATGRAVVLVGRSLWRITEAAQKCGYLRDAPPFLEADDATDLQDNQILYLCTGSQGEERAALPRIAAGQHRQVSLGTGDTVIFSSRVIPGNEKAISRLQNRLVRSGVRLITEKQAPIHVSGHPGQEELKEMYAWVQPRTVIPVHGEERHLVRQAQFALECGIKNAHVVRNGDVVAWQDGEKLPQTIGKVRTGYLALRGDRLIDIRSPEMREIGKVLLEGNIVISLAVDEAGEIAAPLQLSCIGVLHDNELDTLAEEIEDAIADELEGLTPAQRKKDDVLRQVAIKATRLVIRDETGMKPRATVHLLRV